MQNYTDISGAKYREKHYIRFTRTQGCQDTPICVGTKQPAGQLANRASIPIIRGIFFFFLTCQAEPVAHRA